MGAAAQRLSCRPVLPPAVMLPSGSELSFRHWTPPFRCCNSVPIPDMEEEKAHELYSSFAAVDQGARVKQARCSALVLPMQLLGGPRVHGLPPIGRVAAADCLPLPGPLTLACRQLGVAAADCSHRCPDAHPSRQPLCPSLPHNMSRASALPAVASSLP